MNKATRQSEGRIAWIFVIVVIVGGLYILDQKWKLDNCREMALAAAVDEFPISEYPNAGEREILQGDYRREYERSCR